METGRNVAAVACLVAAGVGLGGALVFVGLNMRPTRESRRPRREQRDVAESDSDDESIGTRRFSRSRRGLPQQVSERSLRREVSEWSVQRHASSELPEHAMGVGFSMEQARNMADAGQAVAMNRSPAEVLALLQKGNVRFWTGQASRPEKSAFERRALISKQFPSTAILSCSDSRVPVEIVFDQGLGDMFVVRVAGNCLDTTTTASLQYAVHHLKVKLLIVMGHEGCGAVKAAQLPIDAINEEPETLGRLLKGMRKGLDAADLARVQDVKAADREAVTTNVKAQVESLARDKGIMAKVQGGELMMFGAFYEISSGIVDFFHEVSGTESMEAEDEISRAPSRGVLSLCPWGGSMQPGETKLEV